MKKYRLSEESRPFTVQENGSRRRITLHQLIAERQFADVLPGTPGGWVESEQQLSHDGDSWIYHHNSLVWGGARVTENARVLGECMLSDGAWLGGKSTVDSSQIQGAVQIGGSAQVLGSKVSGHSRITAAARVEHCEITGSDRAISATVRIEGQAQLYACRVAHQASIGEQARLRYVLVDHRAAIYGQAELLGNDINHIWVCDCAQVYDSARLIAGELDGQSPVLRYGARVFGNAEVYGDCLLRQRVQVGGEARLRGGPLVLDGQVEIGGHARLEGDILVEDRVVIAGRMELRATDSALHIRGPKFLDGDSLITQVPYYGLY